MRKALNEWGKANNELLYLKRAPRMFCLEPPIPWNPRQILA